MKMIAAVLAVAFLAAAVPVDADLSVREKNERWVLSHWVNYDPDGIGTLNTGAGSSQHTGSELLGLVVDRFGDVDMTNIANNAVNGEFPAVGDVWLTEFGSAPCPTVSILVPRSSPDNIETTDQFWFYGGSLVKIGSASSVIAAAPDGFGEAIEWPTKTAWLYNHAVDYGYNSDFFCIDFGGFAVHLPYINGIVEAA